MVIARSIFLSLVIAVSLAACQTATPYQPKTTAGGFTETRLESNRFKVSFAGNSVTKRETVEGYLLYRAAELALAQGFDSFTIVERRTDRSARTYTTPDPLYGLYGYGSWRPHWRYYGRGYGWRGWDAYSGYPFWDQGLDTQTVEKFEATAEIILTHGPKVAADPTAFDARSVIETLGPKIQRPVVGK